MSIALHPSKLILLTESVNPCTVPILLISLGYMLAMSDDTGIRESAASSLISTSGRTRLFLYFYVLLVCGSVVLGKDPIIRECSAFPTKIGARAINGIFYPEWFSSSQHDSHIPGRGGLVNLRVRGVKHN